MKMVEEITKFKKVEELKKLLAESQYLTESLVQAIDEEIKILQKEIENDDKIDFEEEYDVAHLAKPFINPFLDLNSQQTYEISKLNSLGWHVMNTIEPARQTSTDGIDPAMFEVKALFTHESIEYYDCMLSLTNSEDKNQYNMKLAYCDPSSGLGLLGIGKSIISRASDGVVYTGYIRHLNDLAVIMNLLGIFEHERQKL